MKTTGLETRPTLIFSLLGKVRVLSRSERRLSTTLETSRVLGFVKWWFNWFRPYAIAFGSASKTGTSSLHRRQLLFLSSPC